MRKRGKAVYRRIKDVPVSQVSSMKDGDGEISIKEEMGTKI